MQFYAMIRALFFLSLSLSIAFRPYAITSYMITGWWFQPLWKRFVNWDDDIPNIWKNKSHVPNHQPDYYAKIIII